MPTSPNTNKINSTLRNGLAEFGLMRDRAIEGSKDISGDGPKYFGIKQGFSSTEMQFPQDITSLDSGYNMAIVVPKATTSFDLLQPTFGKQLSSNTPKKIREYLRRVLESV